jgi:hypothetical protein
MELTDKEKGFLERFRGLESEESRDELIFQAEAMVRAALKFDWKAGVHTPPNLRFALAAEHYNPKITF